jgi:hypothetical protein
MIVKLTITQIQSLIEKLDVEIKYQHRLNLVDCKRGTDTATADSEIVPLLKLCYQLKNILLVEQTKQTQASQQAQYLSERRDMLLDYMLVITDPELENAVKSIQSEIQKVVQSIHFDTRIDIEIDETTHKLLASKNILN